MRSCHQCGASCAEDHRFCPACGFPIGALRAPTGDPLIGRTLGGAYTILEHVGSGGMGRVYRAEQATLGKTLAVKVIHAHLVGDESATARFYAEARACSRLNHPNSVSVLDFGRTDDNLLFLVMEFLRGRDLARIIWEEGALPYARAVGIIRQALAALSEAHELGIIHRDIKPENILVESLQTGGDFVKVVDFGLAKIRSDVSPGVTSPGLVCGTPDYMAPEQGRGDPPDPRSDLYGCAVVLFHALTGRLPFEGDVPSEVLAMHLSKPPPDPREFTPDIPASVVEALMKGLAKDPATRYQTAVEFADGLRAAVKRAGGEAGTTTCPRCRARVQAGLKFCGECGARLGTAAATPLGHLTPPGTRPEAAPPRPPPPPRAVALTLAGRDAELSQVELTRARALDGALVALRVVGEEGSGRHRLVATVLESAKRAGDVVVSVGPDPAWAGVAYHPIGRAIRGLLGIPAMGDPVAWLDEHSRARSAHLEPAVRAGFVEVFTPEGDADLGPAARRDAVVRALAFALREAAQGARGRAVVLAVEQLHRVDSASVRVLAGLLARPLAVPAFVLLTHAPRFQVPWSRSDAVALAGLTPEQARLAAAALVNDGLSMEFPPGPVLPLHLDQLARWTQEGGGPAPARLVDLVSARLERLPPRARRIVQALAVGGDETRAVVAAVVGDELDPGTVKLLVDRGWMQVTGEGRGETLRVAHALLREVADASIPTTLRTEIHAAWSQALKDHEVPEEVQALHAVHAGDPFQALLLLERVGDRAIARGDDVGAVLALRQGLECARRELARGEMDEPERAIVIFTRKLGEVLLRAGDVAEAEGVLREAVGVASRTNPEWARIEGMLGRALVARGRLAEGLRRVDSAIAAALKAGARSVAAELLAERADLEAGAKMYANAAEALARADALLREAIAAGGSGTGQLKRQRVESLLRLARARRLSGGDAAAVLDEAADLADELDWVIAKARCDAERAERAELAGDRRAALAAWRRGALAARAAGDAALEATCDERVRRLGRHEVA